MPLGIEIFMSLKDLEATWHAAEAQGICYGFGSYAWLSTWQETIGTFERVKPCIVQVIDESGATAMLLALGISWYCGCSVLSFLGGESADYHSPILREDFARTLDDTSFARLWEEIIRRLPPVDIIYLARLPEYIEGLKNPFARLSGARRSGTSYFTVLGKSFAEFRRPRQRHSNRQRRRLAKIGKVSFHVALTPAEIAHCMTSLMKQRLEGNHGPAYKKIFNVPAYRAFYERMGAKHGCAGLIHVSALKLDDTILAAHWGMIYRNRFYWLVPSYDEGRCATFSPGRLLLEHEVEWCFGRGIAIFDFTIGDEAYKSEWTDRTMALYDIEKARTLKGWILVVLRLSLVHVRERIKARPRLFAIARRAWRTVK
jgi:CelD/BcsL family acetyltransferase involved in cellulose biosynthesis